MRHIVLVLLTVQNAGAVLLMRYTRSIPGETEFITQASAEYSRDSSRFHLNTLAVDPRGYRRR